MPIPARICPHEEYADKELRKWISTSGLGAVEKVSDWVTGEQHVRLAALTMPDADPERLSVIAEWYTWLFAFDDLFDISKIGRDRGKAVNLIRGAIQALPGDRTPRVEPKSPIEWGLADLCQRTTKSMSEQWQRRFIGHCRDYLNSYTLEIDNRLDGSVTADLIGYLDMRRDAGATRTVFDLIEFSQNIEIPELAYQTLIFQSMLLASIDTVCITNDIFSYDKERGVGEGSNIVFLAERFLDSSPQQAVEFVNDLQISRLRTFERMEERLGFVYALCPEEQHAVDRCVAGLKSWIRGNLDWSYTTRRYESKIDTWEGERLLWMNQISGLGEQQTEFSDNSADSSMSANLIAAGPIEHQID